MPQVGGAPAPFSPQGNADATDAARAGTDAEHERGNRATRGRCAGGDCAGGPWRPFDPLADRLRRNRCDCRRDIHVPAENTQLTAALEKLTQWGVRDQELKPWGSGGELMRFSCSAPWANSPSYTQHFEAVAATPLAAVEQVAFEIEAWQRGQR